MPERAPRARIADGLFRILPLVGVSVLLVLVVFEVGLRLAKGVAPVGAAPDSTAALFTLSENESVVFELAPDVRVTFPAVDTDAGWNPDWSVSTDARGLRRNGDALANAAEPDAIGICLGDSIMFGSGLNDDETIPAQLSRRVSDLLGKRFDCQNFGVSNYTTAQEVDFFAHKRALEREPVVVVLEVFTNDFKKSPGLARVLQGRTELIKPGSSAWISSSLSDLRLWGLGATSIEMLRDELRQRGLYPKANGKPLKPVQIAAVYDALDELRAMLEPEGIPLLVVFFPRDWQLGEPDREAASERQRVVRDYCEEHHVAYVDLLDHWYGKPLDAYFRPGDDSHPHARAVQVISETIAAEVVALLAQ